MKIMITMKIFKTVIIMIMISLMMKNDKYFDGVVGLNENYDYNVDF